MSKEKELVDVVAKAARFVMMYGAGDIIVGRMVGTYPSVVCLDMSELEQRVMAHRANQK